MTNANISLEQHAPEIGSRREQRGNILRLSLAQALAGANSTVIYATGAIIGAMLAPDKALATLPISIFVVGMAACILPTGKIAHHYGRRAAFLAGTVGGVLAGLLAALAVILGSFWIFCLATFFGGAYAAVVLSFRFAAADCVEPEWRPRALSIVMAGGVAAGVIGPQLVTFTMDLWPPHMFAATFIAQAVVAALSAIVLTGVRLPMPTTAELAGGGAGGHCAATALHSRGDLWRGVLHADELPDDRRAARHADVRP
ncbi:MFS transporter [Sphingobium scionense]